MSSVNQQIAEQLMELTSQLPRVQASMTRQLKKAFAEYQRDMLAAVAKADVMGVTARRYQQKRALALIASVKELTTKHYRDIYKHSEAELISLGKVASDSMLSVVNGVAGGDLLTKTLTSPQMKYLVKHSVIDGATSAEWWGKQASDTTFKFNKAVQDAMIKGEGTDGIVRRIRGTRKNGYRDGFMNTAYNNARSLTHTSVQNVANESRLQTMNENDDVLEGIEWLSTLDGHTTQKCKTLDGLVWDMNHKPVGHKQEWVGATAHWQCRSTQVPVLKGFSDLPKRKQNAFKGKRASMDGKKSGSLNYDKWLKKKDLTDPMFVRRTLGAKKYDIWRAKGLSMLDMVDQHNNPLSVAQLVEKFGALPFAPPVVPPKKKTPAKADTKPRFSLRKVNTSSLNDVAEYERQLARVTDKQLKLMKKMPPPIEIMNDNGKGYFQPWSTRISSPAIGTRDGGTLRHEYGHHIDNIVGKRHFDRSHSYAISANDPDFVKAMEADRKALGLKMSKTKFTSMEELYNKMHTFTKRTLTSGREMTDVRIKTNHAGISDIIDAMTRGLYQKKYGTYGHGVGYYKRRGMVQEETFANMFQIRATPEWKEVKRLFPATAKRFDELIDLGLNMQ